VKNLKTMSYQNYFYTPLIHFHEPKYDVFPFVHEFWNTVSNIFYIIVGVNLVKKKNPLGVQIVYVGIFSAMFHASGLLVYEICDEMSILIMTHSILEKTKYKNWWFVYPVYIFGIYCRDFRIFYFILTIMSIVAVIELKRISTNNGRNDYFYNMLYFFMTAKIFWFAEHYQQHWYGHMFWHMFSAISLGYAGLIIFP